MLSLADLRGWAAERPGLMVRVTFTDPYWWTKKRPTKPPILEVFGRLGSVTDDGFDVVALNLATGAKKYMVHAAEGQFVFWSLVVEVRELHPGSLVYGAEPTTDQG